MKPASQSANRRPRVAAWLLLVPLFCLAGCRPDGGPPGQAGGTQQPAAASPTVNATPPSAAASPSPVGAAEAAPVAALFRPVLSQLKSETRVPVLLPGELPPALAERKVYLDSFGKPEEYSITLTSRPDCGANACTIGYFEAKRGGKPSPERRVKLARGVEGFYQPLTCGGSCTPPTIEWVFEGVLYTIQLDVAGKERLDAPEEERRLIRVADSAIDAGPR